MIPVLIFLLIVVALTFAATVTVRAARVDRPADVSSARWVWLTTVETASAWFWWAVHSLRGLPLLIRASRQRRTAFAGGVHAPQFQSADPLRWGGTPREERSLPPLRTDRARFGAVADELAGMVDGVPADHLAVHLRIATAEFETKAQLLEFYARESRAAYSYGDAWLAHAEGLLNGLGLDPAVVQAAAMLAEAHGDMAAVFAMVARRLIEVYALLDEHIDGGGTIPFNARQFLQGF